MTDQNAGTAEEISIRGRSRRRGSVKPEQGHTEKHTEKIEREERTRRQTKRGKHAEPESSGSESAKMTAQILNPEWSEEEDISEAAGERRQMRARSRRRGSQNEETRNRLENSNSGTDNSSADGQARQSVRRSRTRQSEPTQVNTFEASAGGAVAECREAGQRERKHFAVKRRQCVRRLRWLMRRRPPRFPERLF
jgi:hypothetical protein